MQLSDFIEKAAIQGSEYVTEVDYDDEKIKIYFEDGNRSEFKFDEWFYLYEAALHIVSINSDLSENS